MSFAPRRRRIRLPAEAYRRPGSFFVTICAKDRQRVFGTCDRGTVTLSPIGDICRARLLAIPVYWREVAIDEWIIMPDHLHLILHLRSYLPQGMPQVIAGLKAGVSREATRRSLDFTRPLWQRGFHDRALASPDAFRAARRYILTNPSRSP